MPASNAAGSQSRRSAQIFGRLVPCCPLYRIAGRLQRQAVRSAGAEKRELPGLQNVDAHAIAAAGDGVAGRLRLRHFGRFAALDRGNGAGEIERER